MGLRLSFSAVVATKLEWANRMRIRIRIRIILFNVRNTVACCRRSESGAGAKKKASERAGKNEGRLGKRTRKRL